MKERYFKSGSSVRLERSGRAEAIARVRESGVAELDGSHFRCQPASVPGVLPDPPSTGELESLASSIHSLVRQPARLERLAIAAGASLHIFESHGARRSWSDESARIHASLVDPARGVRAIVDLGGSRLDRIDLSQFESVAAAFALPRPAAALLADRVRLEPLVAAHLWLALALHGVSTGGSLVVRQSSHPELPFDGQGARIRPRILGRAGAALPNVFRPSYRIAPVRLPFHVLAESSRPAGRRRSALRAVALLSPFTVGRKSVDATVLATDGDFATAATLAIPRESIERHVASIARRRAWFPLAAGAWGADTELEGIELRQA